MAFCVMAATVSSLPTIINNSLALVMAVYRMLRLSRYGEPFQATRMTARFSLHWLLCTVIA